MLQRGNIVISRHLVWGFSSNLYNSSGPSDLPEADARLSGSEAEDSNVRNPNGASSEENPTMSGQKKTCADCGTSKTPLWRGGPAGPKSLCNACGIKSRKKKRAILGLKGKRSSSSNNSNGSGKIGDSLKQRLMALGREVLMQRSTAERQRKKLGEEEQAAVLLMALSYGSVYA